MAALSCHFLFLSDLHAVALALSLVLDPMLTSVQKWLHFHITVALHVKQEVLPPRSCIVAETLSAIMIDFHYL